MTSNAPPSVSPASLAASMAAIICCCSSASTQRSGIVGQRKRFVERYDPVVGKGDTADRGDVAGDANAEAAEQLSGQRAGRDAGGGLARAGALEHVADVGVAVLDRAGEVGMARSRPRHVGTILGAGRALRHLRLDVHRLLPVHPVAIANEQGDGCAGGDAVAHAGEDLGAVAFDLHAPAAAVAALATTELQVERVDIELKARGHAVDRDDERLAVRLARGQKSEHSFVILYDPPSPSGRPPPRCALWRTGRRRGGFTL